MNRIALLFVAFGALVLAALFVWLRPGASTTPLSAPTVDDATAMPAAITTDPTVHRIGWVVRDGHRLEGPERIAMQTGDTVEITIDSDHDDELHVHGYDLHLTIHANQPASLRFTADHAGRFDCALHHSDLALGALDVSPR